MKKLTIAIDVDNTVSNSSQLWHKATEIALKELGLPIVKKENIFSSREAYSLVKGTKDYEYVLKRQMEFNIENWKMFTEVKDSPYYIQKLKEDGHRIIFISARNDPFFNGDANTITKKWLKYKNIPFDFCICNIEEKGKALTTYDADILIDDGLSYCEMALKENKQAIYFFDELYSSKQSGENSNPKIHTATNWKQVYELISNLSK